MAIAGHNEGEITLSFYDQYNLNDVKGELKIAKNVKLSALFNYVLSQGRTFYYFNPEENDEEYEYEDEIGDEDDGIWDDEINGHPYVSYEDEKARLVLKDCFSPGGVEIRKDEINDKGEITIGDFYRSNKGKVYMVFK